MTKLINSCYVWGLHFALHFSFLPFTFMGPFSFECQQLRASPRPYLTPYPAAIVPTSMKMKTPQKEKEANKL